MNTTRLFLLFLLSHSVVMQAAGVPMQHEQRVPRQRRSPKQKSWWQRNWGYVVAGVAVAAAAAGGGYWYWQKKNKDVLADVPNPEAVPPAGDARWRLAVPQPRGIRVKPDASCVRENDHKLVVGLGPSGLGHQATFLSWLGDSEIPAFRPEEGVSHQELFGVAVPGDHGRIVLQKRWYDARQLKYLYERYGTGLVVLFGENVSDYQAVTDMAVGQRGKIRGGRGGQAFALGGCNRPNAHGIKTTPGRGMSDDDIVRVDTGHLDRSLEVVRDLLNEGRTILIPVAKDGSHSIGQALSGLSGENKKAVRERLAALVDEVRAQDLARVVELNENQQLT